MAEDLYHAANDGYGGDVVVLKSGKKVRCANAAEVNRVVAADAKASAKSAKNDKGDK